MASGGRTRVLVLLGGRSAEHEISCLSARNVLASLDPERYAVTTVGITPAGRWTLLDGVPQPPGGSLPRVPDDGDTVALAGGRKHPVLLRLPDTGAAEDLGPVDVCFPVLHGPYGEDGSVQGLLASLDVPYVGADVAASAAGMDKRQMKSVFAAEGLPQVGYLAVRKEEWDRDRRPALDEIERVLGLPAFTKPARQGSSIGIAKCASSEEVVAGVEQALGYDRVAIVERCVTGARELECGVLGNDTVEVTAPGEIQTGHDFYDFDGKYLDEGLQLHCPAKVDEEIAGQCMAYARDAYRAIGARGMARVDFFYIEDTQQVLVNEINTIPGFTPASMFPRVWAAEGVPGPVLVDRLLELAVAAAQGDARFAPHPATGAPPGR